MESALGGGGGDPEQDPDDDKEKDYKKLVEEREAEYMKAKMMSVPGPTTHSISEPAK